MKLCSKCNIEKEESEFGRLKDSHGRKSVYYPKHYCKECERKYQRDWNKKRRDEKPPKEKVIQTHKFCKKCNQTLPVDLFGRYLDKRPKEPQLRIATYCKKCNNSSVKISYNKKKNNESFKKLNRGRANKWREDNYEKRPLT